MDFSIHRSGDIIGDEDNKDKLYLRIPINFQLGHDELITLKEISIRNITIIENEITLKKLEHSNIVKIFVSNESQNLIEPRLPIVLRPDSLGENKLIIEICLFKCCLDTISDSNFICIYFSAIFKTVHPITFTIRGCFDTYQPGSFTIYSIKRDNIPHTVFINFLLFIIPSFIFLQWNSTINRDVYSKDWISESSYINNILFFICGFLGLQIVSGLKMIRSASDARQLYKFPELYLTNNTFKILKSSIFTVILVIFISAYVYIIHSHKIVKLPKKEDIGSVFAIFDERDDSHSTINRENCYLQDINYLKIKYLYDQNDTPIVYGRLLKNKSYNFIDLKLESYIEWDIFRIKYNYILSQTELFQGNQIWDQESQLQIPEMYELKQFLKNTKTKSINNTFEIVNIDGYKNNKEYNIDITFDEGKKINISSLCNEICDISKKYINNNCIMTSKEDYQNYIDDVLKLSDTNLVFRRHQLVDWLRNHLLNIYDANYNNGKYTLLTAMGLTEIYRHINKEKNEGLPIDEITDIYRNSHKKYIIENSNRPQPPNELMILYWTFLFKLEKLDDRPSALIESAIEDVWGKAGAERFFKFLELAIENDSLLGDHPSFELRREFFRKKISTMQNLGSFEKKFSFLKDNSDINHKDFLNSLINSDKIDYQAFSN